MRVIVITGDRDSTGKHDYTGAFLPESIAFAKHYGVQADDVLRVNLGASKPERVMQALTWLTARSKGEPFGLVAVFEHGLARSLPRLGFGLDHLPALAGAITSTKRPDVRVVLYACSAAAELGAPGGDGDFCDKFRDALCAAGAVDCQVDGHRNAGHAVFNPNVVRFDGGGSPHGGIGGKWLVAPGSPHWNAWRTRLRAKADDLRYRFPLMTREQIEADLKGP